MDVHCASHSFYGILLCMIGSTFGRLTVIAHSHNTAKNSYWRCLCICGNEKIVGRQNLRGSRVTSCGCYRSERVRQRKLIHGESGTRLWICWHNMCHRTRTKRTKCYEHVTLCDEWQTYENFRNWALTHGYRDDLTIDRINGDFGYSPENCRWATPLQQRHNRRASVQTAAAILRE
jgi:hypothetical protein